MKKVSKKGVLLFAGAMALCAFMMPSMASASSWGVVGTHHTLDSPNIGFTTSGPLGAINSQCTRSSFTSNVASTQNLEITTGTFGGLCTLTGPTAGTCTATPVGTKFPWTATPVTTENVQLHGVHIDVFVENVPGLPAGSCLSALVNQNITITGTLSTGRWTGNALHSLDFSDAEGLVSHLAAIGSNNTPITTRGLITDTQNGLVIN
jgi:hypothetical protein